MDRKKIFGMLVIGALAVAAIFGAVTSQVQASAATSSSLHVGVGRGGPGGVSDSDLATALGITTEQLQAAYQTANDAALKQAVEKGLLTQAQADQLKAKGSRYGDFGKFASSGIDYNALLANALGITVEKLQAAYQQAYDAALARAVTEGRITQEQADMIKARTALYDSSKFQSAMQSAFEAAVKQAVSDGLITQAQADQILKENSTMNFGRMFGGHGGFGGPGGKHGGRGGEKLPGGTTTPRTQSTPSGGA